MNILWERACPRLKATRLTGIDQALATMQGQPGAAAFAVVHFQAEAVQADDGRHDGQAQAKAAVFVIDPIKALEHCHSLGLGDAGADRKSTRLNSSH